MLTCRRHLLAVFAISCSAAVAIAADRDPPLRWKFAKGQTFAYQIEQNVELALTVGPTTPDKTTVEQTIELAWTVDDVNPETGDAEMTHKIARIAIKIDSPATGRIEFDSDSEADVEGVAKLLSPVLRTLVGSEVRLRMSPRGDINKVRVPDDVLGAFKKVPGAAMFGEMFSQEGFRNLIKQASMVLPDKVVEKGWEHTQPHVVKSSVFGKMTADTTYTYEGMEKLDARELAKFAIAQTLAFDKDAQGLAKVAVKSQESSGVLYFDTAKGRLDNSRVSQSLTIEVNIAGQKVEQRIKSNTVLKVKE